MTVSFSDIPTTWRVPFVAAEFNATKASQGPAVLAYRALLVGQKTSAGTGAADTIYRVTSAAQVSTLAGRGSMLHRMAIAWFKANTQTELWIGLVADNGAGVAASGTITVTGPATAAGTIALWLGGERVTVAVASGDSANTIASAINAAINANLDLPVTSTVASAVVTVAHRHKGVVGNSYNMRHSYRSDEALPTGTGLTFVQLASGATNPTLTSLIAALADTWFHILPHPYTDSTSLSAIEAEMLSRAGAARMIDGLAITAAAGSQGTLATLGAARNSPYSVILSQPGENPLRPPGEFAAEAAALIALSGAADPAQPLKTLAMTHALPPAEVDMFTQAERNLLLFDGIATTKVVGSVVQLERIITTYQTNAAGADDTAYLDATTILTLSYLRYSFRTEMATRYPRHKLASDGNSFGPGQAVITPKDGKGEAISWFKKMQRKGLVEGLEQFKRDLVVERNTDDPNRLDFLLPPDLVNQLMGVAASIQFRL